MRFKNNQQIWKKMIMFQFIGDNVCFNLLVIMFSSFAGLLNSCEYFQNASNTKCSKPMDEIKNVHHKPFELSTEFPLNKHHYHHHNPANLVQVYKILTTCSHISKYLHIWQT